MKRACRLSSAALGLAALFATRVAAAESTITDQPGGAASPAVASPAEDLPSPAARLNLALTGVAVTGAWYALALGGSFAFSDAKAANELRIPLVGPWMGIADTGCRENDPDCSTVIIVFGALLMGIDGVGQAAGLGFALESLFLPTASGKRSSQKRASVRAVPVTNGRDSLGLGLTGTF